MEKRWGQFRIESSDNDEVFVVLGNSWVKVENRGGDLVVLANHVRAGLEDGREVCTIDSEDGTIRLGGAA
tara:strand:- start:10 stop:219 length:210 start_codon:yes stop_codon:yes gene_type:complete